MTNRAKIGPVTPTENLDEARAALARHGFCVVPNALDPGRVSALRTRLLEQCAAERERGLGFVYGEVAAEPGKRNFLPNEDNTTEPPNS